MVISQLGPGGAERMLSAMANYWADRGLDITVVTLGPPSEDFYRLKPKVDRRALNLESSSQTLSETLSMTLRRLRALRKEIVQSCSDVVVSFMDVTNILTIVATRGLGIPVIVSERVDPSRHDIGKLRGFCRRVSYRFAAAVVVQSEQIAAAMDGIAPKGLVRVIPNFVLEPLPPLMLPIPGTAEKTVVSVGSLVRRKQFDVLLRAFAQVAKRHENWRLVIAGEGPERGRLETLTRTLEIASKVQLLGLVSEPDRLLRQADLFVLTSRYEGLPNALLEAMACGLPVVSFDCPGGPRAIIRHGIDGILVPDQDLHTLTMAMDRLMSNQEERRLLGSQAREVTQRFGIGCVMAMWNALVDECAQRTLSGGEPLR